MLKDLLPPRPFSCDSAESSESWACQAAFRQGCRASIVGRKNAFHWLTETAVPVKLICNFTKVETLQELEEIPDNCRRSVCIFIQLHACSLSGQPSFSACFSAFPDGDSKVCVCVCVCVCDFHTPKLLSSGKSSTSRRKKYWTRSQTSSPPSLSSAGSAVFRTSADSWLRRKFVFSANPARPSGASGRTTALPAAKQR